MTLRRWGWLWIGVLLAACVVAAGSIKAASAQTSTHKELFKGADLFSLRYASDPQIRPDGRAVAYVRVSFDVMSDRSRSEIWLIEVESREQSPLAVAEDVSSPRWSPDGRRLAYLASDDRHRSQIFVRSMSSSQSSVIMQLPGLASDLSWSPDGRWIAFTMRTTEPELTLGTTLPRPTGANWAAPPRIRGAVRYRNDGAGYLTPGYRHVFVVAAEGGYVRQLTSGEFNHVGPISWSNDSQAVLVSGNRRPEWQREPLESELYEVRIHDGVISTLTRRDGPDHDPSVSRDGKAIAYLGFDDRQLGSQNTGLYVMQRDGSGAKLLTGSLDRSIDAVAWAPDGRSLFAQYTDHGRTLLAQVFLDGRMQTVTTGLAGDSLDRPYTGGVFSVSATGAIAFTSGATDRPPEISIARAGRNVRLTHLNEPLLEARKLGAMRELAVRSSADGRAIQSWLVIPPDFDPKRRYPLILEIHGGPFLSSYGPSFATDHQLFAAAGYVVLFCNPRGSTSYGEEFANLIHRAYPGQDYDDLMSAVDAAIATGFIDPQQLFVTGSSGGGFLTAWIVGRTQRFRAAAPQKAMVNWSSMALTSDMYTTIPRYWFGAMPWEDPDFYWSHSPLSLVANVATPTLMVVGELDYRTPLSESEQFYQALQLRGVPSLLLTIPGASHGSLSARPSQSAARVSAILAWFERFGATAAQ